VKRASQPILWHFVPSSLAISLSPLALLLSVVPALLLQTARQDSSQNKEDGVCSSNKIVIKTSCHKLRDSSHIIIIIIISQMRSICRFFPTR
jgi:hypothetical protein